MATHLTASILSQDIIKGYLLLKHIIFLQDDIKYLGQIFRVDKHSSQVQML